MFDNGVGYVFTEECSSVNFGSDCSSVDACSVYSS